MVAEKPSLVRIELEKQFSKSLQIFHPMKISERIKLICYSMLIKHFYLFRRPPWQTFYRTASR